MDIHTYRQRDIQRDTTKIVYHATSRVVNKQMCTKVWNFAKLKALSITQSVNTESAYTEMWSALYK